jgi:DNA-binding XRE family transcriptional regulator
MKILANKEKLVTARIEKGYTGAELARRSGITKMGYYNIEKQKHGVDPSTAKSICEALEKDFDELFNIIQAVE